MLIGVGAGLAVAELGVRLLVPMPELLNFDRLAYSSRSAEQAASRPLSMMHAAGWWVSEPDHARAPYSFNLYGFRDGEWSSRKRDGVERVAFVGDSFVEGLGAGDDDTIPRVFGRRAAESGRPVEAMSFGVAGIGLREYLTLVRDLVPAFHPDHLVLVIYMNDLYDVPQDPLPLLLNNRVPQRLSPWRSRLLYLSSRAWHHLPLPHVWRSAPGPARPLPVDAFFRASPGLAETIDRVVAPDVAASMKAGWFNPAVANLAARSERVLPEPVEVDAVLRILHEFLSDRSVQLWLVYLPSLNQVSDAYLPAQLRFSAPIEAPTLTADRFQQQARDLAAAANRLRIPFLDLTPALRDFEGRGRRLYWDYDGHMRRDGYEAVAGAVLSWWRSATAR